MDDFASGRVAKKGRRANLSFEPGIEDGSDNFNGQASEPVANSTSGQFTEKPSVKKKGGWANESPKEKRKSAVKKKQNDSDVTTIDDERLRKDHQVVEESDEIPVIPDLDDFQEEDLANKIAAPPSVQVNRVATYKELDNDFQKHLYLLTLDDEIDLKLLGKVLAPESTVFEEDKVWDWDRLFTEVSSELQTEWETRKTKNENRPQPPVE
ncbi:intraflagellar transport protein 43 homolog A-like isoform X2 [Dendronephthya gigantea]|uniref:intraflagellar transport protein 43 homolog A-like isoform X2 n=1 Tax=Dendronephthya gigantea TaxID=151771 RepID=UPI00106B1F34|nr:intraflagellar transport protein 43 homolog A-like isoform X2 [Dendronephthya gigantea]